MVGLAPHPFKTIEQPNQQAERRLFLRSWNSRLIERVRQFAENIELKLPVSRVADSHRRSTSVALQPRCFPFTVNCFCVDVIHHAKSARISGGGMQQPVFPGASFMAVAGMEKTEQG